MFLLGCRATAIVQSLADLDVAIGLWLRFRQRCHETAAIARVSIIVTSNDESSTPLFQQREQSELVALAIDEMDAFSLAATTFDLLHEPKPTERFQVWIVGNVA